MEELINFTEERKRELMLIFIISIILKQDYRMNSSNGLYFSHCHENFVTKYVDSCYIETGLSYEFN